MHPAVSAARFVWTSLIGGLFGVIAIEWVMWVIGRAEWAKGNMVTALGGLVTRNRDTAFSAGCWIHAVSAVVFAAIYQYAMIEFGVARFPAAIFVGIGFGVIHGVLVSIGLVWIVAEQHPLEEFRAAGLAVGLRHLAGHIAYGAVVGLVIAISSVV